MGIIQMQRAASNQNTRRQKILDLVVVRSTLIKSCVALLLGPENLGGSILRSRVPQNWQSRSRGSRRTRWQGCPQRGLYVEIAESLARANIGLHARVRRAVFGLSGRNRGQRPDAQRVGPVLRVAGGNAVLGQEREIAHPFAAAPLCWI